MDRTCSKGEKMALWSDNLKEGDQFGESYIYIYIYGRILTGFIRSKSLSKWHTIVLWTLSIILLFIQNTIKSVYFQVRDAQQT
jgi:hypothetical protein